MWKLRSIVYGIALIPAFLVVSEGLPFAAFVWAIFAVPAWIAATLYEKLFLEGEEEGAKRRRGRKLLDHSEATSDANSIRQKEDKGILWGGLRIPSSEATTHFCIVGAVGSGKSLTIKLLMQDQLTQIAPGSDARALIYDSKQDVLPFLAGMKLNAEVVTLNPFDERSSGWNMAADVTTLAHATELANILVPEVKGESQPFFPNAVRTLLKSVLTVFITKAPGKWTFRQVLLVMQSPERLEAVIRSHPRTKEVANQFLSQQGITLSSIYATIATKMSPFEPIAAAWDKADRQFSIKEWVKGSSILVLGNDETSRSTLDLMNRVFVKFASEQSLAVSEASHFGNSRRSWFFLDEFREAGNLPGLQELVLRGRSKGCCVVLGFQDIEGLQEAYGEKVANELVGQCGQKALLRLESPKTAEWASQVVSKAEFVETSLSEGFTSQGRSVTYAESIVQRDEVLGAEFLSLPPPSHKNGLNGVYLSRAIGVYKHTYDFSELLASIATPDPHTPPYLPRDANQQFIELWSQEDDYSLGLTLGTDSDPVRREPIAREQSELDKVGRISLDD